jgi:two-component system, response regulator YesN
MYNLLLVDDEPWILKDMEQIIDWEEAGFNIVAMLKDVDRAESVIRRQHIDVLISDIRMPGKSGLDLLSFVNRVSPHTLVVFMSAYSEFEYAKQAIERGCFNYLLKPVNIEELQQTLAKCSQRLAEKDKERKIQSVYDQSMLFLEWIEKDSMIEQIIELLPQSSANSLLSLKSYVFATVKSKGSIGDDELIPVDHLLQQSGLTSLRVRISPFKWTYLLGLPKLLLGVATKLDREMHRISKECQWDIGLSSIFPPGSRVGRVYQQSRMMADTSTLNGKVGIHAYTAKVNSAVPALREQISKASRLEHLEAALFDVYKQIDAGRIHLSGLTEIYNLFVLSMKKLSMRNGLDHMDAVTGQDLILHCGNPQDLLEGITMLLEEQKKKPDVTNAVLIVEEITRDLDRMYAHRISLKEMAQKYFISPNYLSHLFKQEKGQSFINYLIQKRLKAAISLLEKDISLYEVARLVGYDDYAHFSKLFKKHVGQSPVDYKQGMKRQPEKSQSFF